MDEAGSKLGWMDEQELVIERMKGRYRLLGKRAPPKHYPTKIERKMAGKTIDYRPKTKKWEVRHDNC